MRPLLSELHQLIDTVHPPSDQARKNKRDLYMQQLKKYKQPAYTPPAEDLDALEQLKTELLQKQSNNYEPSCIIS